MNIVQLRGRAKRLLPKNAFARGVSVLVGGTAGAQLMMVLSAPLLTRLYAPEDFGLLAVYSGLLGLFAVAASLRYELAIPLPESDQEAADIVILCLLIVLGMAAIAALIVILAGESVATGLGVPRLEVLFWLLPVGVLLSGIYNVFNYLSIRTKQFPTIARTRIRQAVTTLGIQILGYKLGSMALLLGQAGGQGMGSLSLARPALRKPEFRYWSWQGVRKAAMRYRQFPLFSTWSALFNTAGSQLPPLMFAAFFSVGAAGFYTLAQRVLVMPMGLVGQAVANVFLANAAEANREGKLGELVRNLYQKLVQIAIPPAVILMIAAPEIFTLVFGESWRQSGELARWMAPWLCIVFITSPLGILFEVMEKQLWGLGFQTILLISRASAIIIGAKYGDLLTAVILFSMVSTCCWIGFLYWLMIATGNSFKALYRPALYSLFISFMLISPLWFEALFFDSEGWLLPALILTSMLILFWFYVLFREAYLVRPVDHSGQIENSSDAFR